MTFPAGRIFSFFFHLCLDKRSRLIENHTGACGERVTVKRLIIGLSSLVLLLGGVGQATAGNIGTCTIDGSATGVFEGQPFTNAHIRYTLTYDTDNVVSKFFGPVDPFSNMQQWLAEVYGTGRVSVDGIGSANLGTGRLQAYSPNSDLAPAPSTLQMRFAGISTRGDWSPENDYYYVEGGFSQPFADYDLKSSFVANGLYFGPPPFPFGAMLTDAGYVKVAGLEDDGQWNAQADVDVVPEPASMVLFAVGVTGLAGCGWRRRKQPA
jgi:hypothetical protein